MAARRWSVPARMGLAFTASTIVAVAEVVIYMGYIRRINEAKAVERKMVEKKEVMDTWVIDAKTSDPPGLTTSDNLRHRKGRQR